MTFLSKGRAKWLKIILKETKKYLKIISKLLKEKKKVKLLTIKVMELL